MLHWLVLSRASSAQELIEIYTVIVGGLFEIIIGGEVTEVVREALVNRLFREFEMKFKILSFLVVFLLLAILAKTLFRTRTRLLQCWPVQ